MSLKVNPVIASAEYALEHTGLVDVDAGGVERAARFIAERVANDRFELQSWRLHPLHVVPVQPFDRNHPSTKACLDFIFLVSALNFSFWSEQDGLPGRYAIEWAGTRWTGYWTLPAVIQRALHAGIPILDAEFYASPTKCPDQLLEQIFSPEPDSIEPVPLLKERIAILREVGSILCKKFGGSYSNIVDGVHETSKCALDLVYIVLDSFPSFNDEVLLGNRKVFFWKRAQILVAETWAAFYPDGNSGHPYFPSGVPELTMFADYRVPQLLNHLQVTVYPPQLQSLLRSLKQLDSGSPEEISIRAASIVAVERIKAAILRQNIAGKDRSLISSVLIDFWLWEMAKKVEIGADKIEAMPTFDLLPCHRTRSIWY